MSADNGVYIVRIPNPSLKHGFEWRVAELQNIEDCDYGDKDCQDYLRYQKFGKNVPIFTSEESAYTYAHYLYRQTIQAFGICEYGICMMEFDRPLNPDAKDPYMGKPDEYNCGFGGECNIKI